MVRLVARQLKRSRSFFAAFMAREDQRTGFLFAGKIREYGIEDVEKSIHSEKSVRWSSVNSENSF